MGETEAVCEGERKKGWNNKLVMEFVIFPCIRITLFGAPHNQNNFWGTGVGSCSQNPTFFDWLGSH